MAPDLIKTAKILVIDDDAANLDLYEGILQEAGYGKVMRISDSREAVSQFSYHDPDLVLLDWRMPHDNGHEVLKALHYLLPADGFTPMMVVTGDAKPETRRQALTDGATDFLCKPFDITELNLRIQTLLQLRFLYRSLRDEKATLEQRVRDRTRSLHRVIAELRCSSLPLFSVNF